MDEEKLPELGTKAAAVAGIESLIFTAIRVPGALEPERLRYWLDAYYQARRAKEDAERDCVRKIIPPFDFEKYLEETKRILALAEDDGPSRTPAPTEERIATAPAEPRNDRSEVAGAELSAPP